MKAQSSPSAAQPKTKPAVRKHHLRVMGPADVMAYTDTSGQPTMTLGLLQVLSVADAIKRFGLT